MAYPAVGKWDSHAVLLMVVDSDLSSVAYWAAKKVLLKEMNMVDLLVFVLADLMV